MRHMIQRRSSPAYNVDDTTLAWLSFSPEATLVRRRCSATDRTIDVTLSQTMIGEEFDYLLRTAALRNKHRTVLS